MLKESDEHGVGLGIGGVVGAVGHEDSVLESEQLVHGDAVLQWSPTVWRVFCPATDEEGARGHEGVEFMEIAAFGAELRVETVDGIAWRFEAALAPGLGMVAKIPGLPVVDTGSSIIENDSGV